ncbi:sulfur oxidation c-type cytochrome SoxX [Duganella violaceipulchra]|uniref:Sulfur oxidation c-type cytochrome SoxX n=1 Tax=Duganella violaceipulchra TaxID=2849652 RepID=A0AA41HAD1_9BURK|nr:sulfur oxidation c-type cytochrome SoxX [Duganella violaceicalia]MBV6320541.1 sulfur oxidation c-type cytochrome SoxX [Duganella violaceicalia]MCP2008751.1 sulfur-oxidizing protein SoxX [Duganella violaceicalia]
MQSKFITAALLGVLASSAALAAGPTAKDSADLAAFKASFRDKNEATVDRLEQSEAQRLCSQDAQRPLKPAQRKQIEQQATVTVHYPADGNYLGDWKEGEKVAQNGRGLQSSDPKGTPAGGNCYACHKLDPKEIAFGNIGPSLHQYGKLRGGPTPDNLKYTWTKIYNSHAFQACSTMPRFGAAGILTEKQMQDVMALLLAPESPVNQ